MLTCLPQSLCSWDYRILGARSGDAAITFNFFTEQGTLALGPTAYTIRKHGPMSGTWTLEQGPAIIAQAVKPSALFRRFHITSNGPAFDLASETPLTRTFDFLIGDRVVGSIRPAHAFTRRATLTCTPDSPDPFQLFAFWLAALLWRRAAENNNRAPP